MKTSSSRRSVTLSLSMMLIITMFSQVARTQYFNLMAVPLGAPTLKDDSKKVQLDAIIEVKTTFDVNGNELLTNPHLIKDDAKPTLKVDLSYKNILAPFTGFDVAKTQSVKCGTEQGCAPGTDSTIDYQGTTCTVNTAKSLIPLRVTDTLTALKGVTPSTLLLVKKDAACTLDTGVVGLGFDNDFFKYLRKGFTASKELTFYLAYFNELKKTTDKKEKPSLASGTIALLKRASPIGCTTNTTIAGTSATYKFEADVTYQVGDDDVKLTGVPMGNSKFDISGTKSDTYFSVKDSAAFIKVVSQKLCSKDVCPTGSKLSSAPAITFEVKCTATLDLIRKMKMTLKPEDYIFDNGTTLEFLVGDLGQAATNDVSIDKLFFTKYGLFNRVTDDDGDKKPWVAFGFGDRFYTVDKKFWIGVASGVGLFLVLGMSIIGFIFRDKTSQEEIDDSNGDADDYEKI